MNIVLFVCLCQVAYLVYKPPYIFISPIYYYYALCVFKTPLFPFPYALRADGVVWSSLRLPITLRLPIRLDISYYYVYVFDCVLCVYVYELRLLSTLYLLYSILRKVYTKDESVCMCTKNSM